MDIGALENNTWTSSTTKMFVNVLFSLSDIVINHLNDECQILQNRHESEYDQFSVTFSNIINFML